jgi:tetratricopeptide (TPR) repeat protein
MSTLRLDVLRLPTSPLGPPNPLPPLRSQADLHAVDPGPSEAGLDEEMRRGMAYGRLASVLPYLNQSDYGRELVDADHRVAVLENDRLRATFLLGWGGRLWSLVDRSSGRELLYRPGTLQLANLALRDAWFAGGVEWNLGLTGHTPLTCAPLHAARVELSRAGGEPGTPLLRLYEYERMRGLVYQVDAWLPDGSPHLLVHVTVSNPTDATVPLYWWSNTAVPEADDVRVLTPARSAWTFGAERVVRHVPMPVVGGVDRSYPVRSTAAVDYFFDLAGARRPWIAAVDGQGVGLVQSSTRRLRGRKLFLWGDGPGGRHWQQWLSPAGGRYLEIQAGLARTQLEHLPMPAGERWSWLETYGPLQADPQRVHARDWAVGAAEVERVLDATAPLQWLDAAEADALAAVDRPPVETLQAGSGWGALERRRRAASGEPEWRLPGSPFPDEELGPEQQPWLDLLERGSVELELDAPPPSYQVTPAWRERLEAVPGPTAALLAGVAQAHAGDADRALTSWQLSVEEQPNAWAWRNVGVLTAERDGQQALDAYAWARELAPGLAPLVEEQLRLMLELGRPEELLATLDRLPEQLAVRPAVRLLEAQAAVAVGDAERAGAVLEPGLVVPQVREGAQLLEDLWYGYRALVLAAAHGWAADEAQERARREPLPAVYDFSMTAPAT